MKMRSLPELDAAVAGCRELRRVPTALVQVPGVLGESRHEPGAHRPRMRPVDPAGRKPEYPSQGCPIIHIGALTPRYRLPETTRQADRLSRAALR
ncbi:hypothetical protein [Amycolatopsis sp. NPDC051716]|uniref:hypothetical protein n=1 Tax=Amycolatopsis sp. NPDC051716 TaxID=3155804 RepID=UPI0034498297